MEATHTILHTLSARLAAPFIDFFYPPVCFVCRQPMVDGMNRVCDVCWKSFPRVHPGDAAWTERVEKFASEKVVDDFLSCYLFEKEGAFQKVVHFLKYDGMTSLGVRLGEEVGRCIAGNDPFNHADYLVPVPLHRLKKRERGYNQSEYICRGISRKTKIPVVSSLLRRTRYTESQTKLTLEERRENVGEAFAVRKKDLPIVEGRTFILVDDLITTGATINACARVLRSHGAKSVLAASVALAK